MYLVGLQSQIRTCVDETTKLIARQQDLADCICRLGTAYGCIAHDDDIFAHHAKPVLSQVQIYTYPIHFNLFVSYSVSVSF